MKLFSREELTQEKYKRDLNWLVYHYNFNMDVNPFPSSRYIYQTDQLKIQKAKLDLLKIEHLEIKAIYKRLDIYQIGFSDDKSPFLRIEERGRIEDRLFYEECREKLDDEDWNEACFMGVGLIAGIGLLALGLKGLSYYFSQ